MKTTYPIQLISLALIWTSTLLACGQGTEQENVNEDMGIEERIYDSISNEILNPYIEYLDSIDQKVGVNDSVYLITPCNLILKSQLSTAFLSTHPEILNFFSRNQGFTDNYAKRYPDDMAMQRLIIAENRFKEKLKMPAPSVINFGIAKRTFPNENAYMLAKTAMLKAADDWNGLTRVQYRYLGAFDNSIQFDNLKAQYPNEIQMVVAYQNFTTAIFKTEEDYQNTFAIAFNKEFPRHLKVLRICRKFFTPGRLSQDGILRHEIGHIMGFRHEHINSPENANCPKEDFGFAKAVTAYDPNSVMHYPCGSFNNYVYQFSANDSIGIKFIYP
jgi:hypothetical protein